MGETQLKHSNLIIYCKFNVFMFLVQVVLLLSLALNHNLFLRFRLLYILVYCTFPITQKTEVISISISHISSIIQFICTILAFYISLYICLIKNFIAMNNFDFKKYFGNLIGLPTTAPKKGVSPIKISK